MRIISNLFNNSYEALTDKRLISVRLSVLDNKLKLEIEDTGKGIPENRIQDVLGGMSMKHSGLGFGLSGAIKLLKNWSGSLELASKLSKGTSITLLFPIVSLT